MKYLIISDAASMHIYNFIKNSLLGRGYDIYILRHSIKAIPKQYADFYKENNITVFTPGECNGKRTYVQTISRFIKKCIFLYKLGKVDICHIHYLHRSSCKLYRLFRHNFSKLIVSFWGTDILNPPVTEFKEQKKTIKYADAITVTVSHTREVFRKRFGCEYDHSLFFGRFAAGALNSILEFSKNTTREACRKEFNIADGKVCVVCGYNANPAQHQDIILEQIAMLPEVYKEKLHIILPMQYDHHSEDYEDRVRSNAERCGCSFEVLDKYVPFERNAMMSLATDIYLNLRDTDAFSNAMKEQVFAGSLMIQGDWLVYDELDEIKAKVRKISSINELHDLLPVIIDNYEIPQGFNLFTPLYDIFSVGAARKSWDDVLNYLTNNKAN